jgi:hypothetical protein
MDILEQSVQRRTHRASGLGELLTEQLHIDKGYPLL